MIPLNDGQLPAADSEAGLIDHLRELRVRLIRSLLSLIPGFILAYNLAPAILGYLARPLKAALPEGSGLVATALPDTFLVHLRIGFWGAFFLSSPYWLYQIWAFAAPGLYGSERKKLKLLGWGGSLLLFAGAAFGFYVVIPLAFGFFISAGGGDITFLPAVRQYLSLVTTMLAAFGLAFQLPLVLMFLASAGLVDARRLKAFRPYALVAIFILAAVLTPPDVVSQILLALPMLILYELSVFLIARRSGGENS